LRDIEFSKECTDSALQIARDMEFSSGIAKSYHYYGLYNRFKGNADKAIYFFEKALEEYGPDVDSLKISGTIFNLGVMYFNAGDYNNALKYYMIDLGINKKYDNKKGVCNSLNSIGLVFKRFQQFDKASHYLNDAYTCSLESDDKLTQSIVLENLSSLYNQQKNPSKGMYYARKALSLEHELASVYGIGIANYHIACSHYEYESTDSASIYIDKSIQDLETLKFGKSLSDAYVLKGLILKNQNQVLEAIRYFNKSILFSEKAEHNKRLSETYLILSESYEAIGNFESALYFYKKFEILDDSLVNITKLQLVNDLEIKYETEQKETEIEKQSLRIKSQVIQKNAISGGSIFLISLLSLFLWNITQRNRKNQLILQQSSEIKQQQILQLEKENKILSMSSMIEGQESERKRIAQDLHDGLGGLLATIKIKFGIIQRKIEDLESVNVYQQTSSMIDDACTEVRKIAHNMMPDSLTKLGLVEAIRDISEYTSDLNIDVINLGIHQFKNTQEIMIYRVIQEFINNSRKHGEASKVIVQFSSDTDHSYIYLEDDGIGFNMEDIFQKRGLGLESMKSRANFIGGTFELDSNLGVGTTVQIKLPKE